jgi:hypothetical protein
MDVNTERRKFVRIIAWCVTGGMIVVFGLTLARDGLLNLRRSLLLVMVCAATGYVTAVVAWASIAPLRRHFSNKDRF